MNGAGCLSLEPGVVSGCAIHDGLSIETNCNRGLTLGRYLAMASAKSPVVFALDIAPDTLGKRCHRNPEPCSTRGHKK
jgi:hypothetical protein